MSDYTSFLPAMTSLLLDHVADAARRVEGGDYAGDQATVEVDLVGSSRRQQAFAAAGLKSLMTDAFVAYCRQAKAAGEAGEDVAALNRRVAGGPHD